MSSFGTSKPSIRVCLVVQNRLLRETMARLFHKKPGIIVVGKECSVTKLPESAGEPFDVLLMDSLKAGCAKDLEETATAPAASQSDIFWDGRRSGMFLARHTKWGARLFAEGRLFRGNCIRGSPSCGRGGRLPAENCAACYLSVLREEKPLRERAEKTRGVKLGLTYRQRQLMALVAQGMTNKEIAGELNLSEFTVKNHIARVMRQLNADSRHEAAVLIHAEHSAGALN
jgi:Response regulator containing a CheY-like receiver domain and an HTH DNA-binding domain